VRRPGSANDVVEVPLAKDDIVSSPIGKRDLILPILINAVSNFLPNDAKCFPNLIIRHSLAIISVCHVDIPSTRQNPPLVNTAAHCTSHKRPADNANISSLSPLIPHPQPHHKKRSFRPPCEEAFPHRHPRGHTSSVLAINAIPSLLALISPR